MTKIEMQCTKCSFKTDFVVAYGQMSGTLPCPACLENMTVSCIEGYIGSIDEVAEIKVQQSLVASNEKPSNILPFNQFKKKSDPEVDRIEKELRACLDGNPPPTES